MQVNNIVYNNSKIPGGVNRIFYGAPGCGKSYHVKTLLENAHVEDKNIIRVTFHQEYSNSDFVGQILPTITKIIDPITNENKDIVTYKFNPGPFAIALKTAYQTDEMVYLIIEEINRGNAAAIFGDLFQLLDRVKDHNLNTYAQSEYPINNPYIQSYLDLSDNDSIVIPSNMTIYATMNTSDQNVSVLDTAFKRRWYFEQISNDITKDTGHSYKHWFVPGTSITWETFLTKLNDRILKSKVENSSSEDKRLGKYFVSKDCLTQNVCSDCSQCKDEANNFAYKVLEYIWNDVCKYGQGDWFDVEKYRTLEELIDGFRNEGLQIFPHIDFDEQ